jgi:hypothetical protein
VGLLAAVAATCLTTAFPGAIANLRAASARRVRVSPGRGAWCWFADPRAVYVHGRTYVGWVDGAGWVVVGTVSTRGVTSIRIAKHAAPGTRDDHDSPALLVEPDGRITAFYSHHNGRAMYFRTTRRPYDAASWRPERRMPANPKTENTYPNPVHLSAESATYLFWRGDVQPVFSRRHSRGTWASPRQLISEPGQNPYVKVASNDRDTIGFAFTNGHPRGTVTNIYYARYRAGVLSHANGRAIASLNSAPITPAQADEVYDARTHGGRRAWIQDVALTHGGRPVLVYATFSADGYSHRYEYARWGGTRWRTHSIVNAGGTITTDPIERFYSGGLALDHRDPRVVYASVQRGRPHELERFVTRDGGRSWRHESITAGSPTDNVRPVVPRGLPAGSRELLWMRGYYNQYHFFRTAIVAAL